MTVKPPPLLGYGRRVQRSAVQAIFMLPRNRDYNITRRSRHLPPQSGESKLLQMVRWLKLRIIISLK
jgi:hypothetical protein